MMRAIRFQSSLSDSGMTGWMFSVYLKLSLSWPVLKSKLLWKGTLMSEAMGLESFLASSSALAGPPAAAVSEGADEAGVWADMSAGSIRRKVGSAAARRAMCAAQYMQATTAAWNVLL